MSSKDQYLEIIPSGAHTRQAWLMTFVTLGLALVTAALAFDLHNQRRRLEHISAQLKQASTLRESESKSLTAGSTTREFTLRRLTTIATEGEADLKKLTEVFNQREPVVKQAVDVQNKFQALVKDLLDLSKSDLDSRDIVRKYNIQQNPPPPAATPKP